jgi:mono/diheme cytochrome c family protein
MPMPRLAAWFAVAALVAGVALAAAQTAAPPDAAAKAALIARGRYLAQIMRCGDCHTPGAMYGVPDTSRAFSGSELGWRGPWGVHYPANITPDLDSGIGYWTLAELARTLRTGVRPDGTTIGAPMPMQNIMALSEPDAEALARYLQSMKPISHAVPAAVKPGADASGPVLEFPQPSAWDAPRPVKAPAPAAGEKK